MHRTRAALTAALLITLAACSAKEEETNVTVLAAASLTNVFKEAQATYEKKHPGTKLTFSFAGSQELAAQVRQGVPADALVTADTKTMDGLEGRTTTPVTIARNKLTIVTTPGNPKNIRTLADLARPDLKVVLAAPEVPAGRYSKKILDNQHITVKPVSQEANVRAVLSKVSMKEADAGIVYETDAKVAKATTVEIPTPQNAVATYPAATLKNAQHTKEADDFIKWLTSDEARQLLRKAGFEKP